MIQETRTYSSISTVPFKMRPASRRSTCSRTRQTIRWAVWSSQSTSRTIVRML
jgi:hypothetical protein